MEVLSHKDITPDREEGLKIKRDDRLYILREIKQENCFIARKNDLDGEILKSDMENTVFPKWFKSYDRLTAEGKLANPEFGDGDFFIRPVIHGKEKDFAASVKFRNQVHHFKLTSNSNNKGWTCNKRTVQSLQEFVKTFQTTPLTVTDKKKKKVSMTLSKKAETGIVYIPEDGFYYNGAEYDDTNYEDDDYEGEMYGDGIEEDADFGEEEDDDYKDI